MDIKVIDKTDTELKLELRGESHGTPNMLAEALLSDDRVDIASYDIDHPLEGEPVLFLKTTGDDPIEVLTDVAEALRDDMEEAKGTV